jgi:hypothetical protein
LHEGKSLEIEALLNANSNLVDKYIKDYNYKTGKIEIDWAAIEALEKTNPALGAEVEAVISELEGLSEQE